VKTRPCLKKTKQNKGLILPGTGKDPEQLDMSQIAGNMTQPATMEKVWQFLKS
jgi:hypothetical protein